MKTKDKTLADIGEYEFIQHIRAMMPKEGGNIIRSVGDDCLAVESGGDTLALYTIDTFVENVHFKRRYSSYEQTGRRCMTASVSDIAAMSGNPDYSLVSLSMPSGFLFNDAVALFKGLQDTASVYGCPIAGGETTSTGGPLTVTVTVIGSVEHNRIITRSGANPGDSLYVTGHIGDAMAGLLAFDHNEKEYANLKNKFLTPDAFVGLSRALTENFHITSMIDTSDGIATDLGNICRESRCGADIYEDKLPISQDCIGITEKYGEETVDFALSAGEDFELLFTTDDTTMEDKFHLMNRSVTRIGTITEHSSGIRLRRNNRIDTIHSKGYEHFKKAVKKSFH